MPRLLLIVFGVIFCQAIGANAGEKPYSRADEQRNRADAIFSIAVPKFYILSDRRVSRFLSFRSRGE